MPKADLEERLKKQIATGNAIAGRHIRTATGLEPALKQQAQWNEYNIDLLLRGFEGTELAERYHEVISTPNASYQRASRGKTIMRTEISSGLHLLTSILQRLELLPESGK
jgi:hypothetical protein